MPVSIGKGPRPDYDRPPVVETVLGVQFDRLGGFNNGHLGAFWSTLDSAEWTVAEDAPPLPPQFERFTPDAKWSQVAQIQISQDPSSRLKIRNKSNDRMIQVQNTRLHFNWLGQSGEDYPRYEKVREEFKDTLVRFTRFAAQSDVGEFCPNQWEVTYVNHIPKGTVWSSQDDWNFFLPLGSVPTIPDLVRGDGFSGE